MGDTKTQKKNAKIVVPKSKSTKKTSNKSTLSVDSSSEEEEDEDESIIEEGKGKKKNVSADCSGKRRSKRLEKTNDVLFTNIQQKIDESNDEDSEREFTADFASSVCSSDQEEWKSAIGKKGNGKNGK